MVDHNLVPPVMMFMVRWHKDYHVVVPVVMLHLLLDMAMMQFMVGHVANQNSHVAVVMPAMVVPQKDHKFAIWKEDQK